MSLRSPRSPLQLSRQGFQPLRENPPDNMNETMDPKDIPLSEIRTNMSSTGIRQAGTEISPGMPTPANEKTGLFHRKTTKKGGKRQIRPNRIGTDGEPEKITWMGNVYKKIVNFSVITRYMVYVAPIALAIAVPIIVGKVTDRGEKAFIAGMQMFWFFLWIEIVWLSIWISKLFAITVPQIFMFLCGVVSSGTRKYALVLRSLEIPISLVGWAVASLLTFKVISVQKPNKTEGWDGIMIKLLSAALISSVIYLGEKFIVQLISISYHARSFDRRIKESKRNVFLLGLLYDASRALFPEYCKEFAEEDYLINDSLDSFLAERAFGGHSRSGSATPMRLIGDVGRVGDKITSIFGNIASEITGKQVFNPTSAHSIVVEALERTKSSEALARRLWMSFVVEGREALYAEDIAEVLGAGRKEEADECFLSLDQDGNGDISLDEMIMKVVEIGRDRKSIANSMRDVGQAIGVLDGVLTVVVFIVALFIFIALLNTSFVTTLATAGTTLLSLSFVFAVTTQEFLGSCIFLFVKHPYDVGDRVDITGPEREYLVVEQISLLYTVFKRIDSMKMVQVPNIVLTTLWIENITRSSAMKEQLEMYISFDTTLEDIETLRSEMEKFVRSPDNSRDFQPDILLECTGIGNMDKLQLKVEIRHKSNWHNETVRAARRSKFMCALVLSLRKVPIYAPGGGGLALGDPGNPSYSVAVSNELAADARDQAKEAKEAKRLIPSAPAAAPAAGTASVQHAEFKAADALNSRKPTEDAARDQEDEKLADDYWGLAAATNADSSSGGTLNDQSRADNISDLRQGLLKRESTRGKRRMGETAPSIRTSGMSGTSGGAPGLSFTGASPRDERQSELPDFDEESEMGFSGRLNETGYTGYQGARGVGSSANYSIYPQDRTPAATGSAPAGRGRGLTLNLQNSNQSHNP